MPAVARPYHVDFHTLLLCITLICGFTAGATEDQQTAVSGVVRDALTREPLAAANIRVLGTSMGTITNIQGRFSLMLAPGQYLLRISMIGYGADTVRTWSPPASDLAIDLRPAPIVLPEVLATAEDPALEIIRRAIASKRRWLDRLVTYELEAYTRQVLRKDTAIASITESFTRGYWQQGDTLREVILQRRQTENIKAAFNFASVGGILNFNDDRVRFFGYSFVGPTAVDALEYYDYKLLRTRPADEREVFEIRMTPRTRTSPLFAGVVHIESGSYALAGIDVEPNEAFQIPFVKEKYLRYRQQFALYDQIFWLPVDIRINAMVRINVMGFNIPKIEFSQTSVISGYKVNTVLPDSIFGKPRLSVDSTATRIDSLFWQSNEVLPLEPEETRAYRSLDSTQTLDVQFRPRGVVATLGGDVGLVGTVLEYVDARFNRVEGFRLGVHAEIDDLLPVLSLRGGLSYGFSSRMSVYNFGGTVFTDATRVLGFGGDVYRKVDNVPDYGYYGPIAVTLGALLAKMDYPDYFRADGWRATLVTEFSNRLNLSLSFNAEEHRSMSNRTDFSLLYPSRTFRPNPEIVEGRLRSLRLEGRIGRKRVPLDFVFQDGIDLSVEYSSPSFAGSDYDFARIDAVGSLVINTGEAFLLKPGFRIRLAGGASTGTLPPQRLFSIETGIGGYAPFGVMKVLGIKEYSGTGYIALNLEHNFRSLPFLALGIPFLYENNIELLLHGGAARTWGKSGFPLNVTPDIYYEAGFGINRIFEILRADFAWRLSSPGGFRFTVATAGFM